MTLPGWVDYATAERAAATMSRGLSGEPQSWGTLLAHAQAILNARTDRALNDDSLTYDAAEWLDLVAASRILDLAASDNGVVREEDRRAIAILAACAYGMSGTSVSAAAVIRTHRLTEQDLSASELVALAVSCPMLNSEILPKLRIRRMHSHCVESLSEHLMFGSHESLIETARSLDELTRVEAEPWEGLLLRLSRHALEHVGQLATVGVLGRFNDAFPAGYLDRLKADTPILLPSQYEALAHGAVLDDSASIIVTLPTGTGKTLLGEIALLHSLGREPGLVCYIAPYIALGRQVHERVSRHVPRDVRVHRLMGGYREPEPLNPERHQEVVVSTPERFDALLRLRPDLLSAIRCIVFDEAHLVGNGQRGIRLEGVITRLRLAEARGGSTPRLVFLSAVLSNSAELASWLGIEPQNVIRGTWRPCAKRLLYWSADGVLRMHAGDDPLRSNPSEILGELNLPWPKRGFYSAGNIGAIQKQEPDAMENVAYLAQHQHQLYQQPILCICASRAKTRLLASKLADHYLPIQPLPKTLRDIADLIDTKYPYLLPLKYAIERGVAYHNSSLSVDLREAIERAVEARALRAVAATTTLAEGVDLPFRVTVLADWLTFDGEKPVPMASLLFRNISGRCGRAGQFTEGDTIIFDNPVGDAQLTTPETRAAAHDEIFFSEEPPALRSAIGRTRHDEAVAAIGSQILAAVAENPHTDDLSASFRRNSLADRTDTTDATARRIRTAFEAILDDDDGEPLAVAASPIQLTGFGRAANIGGLSPGTAKMLRGILSRLPDVVRLVEDPVVVSAHLLMELGQTPEQRNSDLRRAAQSPKKRPIVRRDEFEYVLERWLAGLPYVEIFAGLPSTKRSRIQPPIEQWLEGTTAKSSWTDRFAKFYEFVDSCIEFYLPWILRAARPIAESSVELDLPWIQWARSFELGVDSPWGCTLIDLDVTTERLRAREVGVQLDALEPGIDTRLDEARLILTREMPEQFDAVENVISRIRNNSQRLG